MKTLLLFLVSVFFLAINTSNGQSSYGTAKWLTVTYGIYYPQPGSVAQPGPDYGCAFTHKNPVWVLISTCGTTNNWFDFSISTSGGNSVDTLSWVIWGPFEDTTNAFSQLSSANIVNCNNSSGFYFPYIDANTYLERNKIYYTVMMCTDSITAVSLSTTNIGVNFPEVLETDSVNCSICQGHAAYTGQRVCIVNVDSASGNNKIYWTPDDSSRMEAFIVYRQNSNMTFDSIGTVQAGGDNSLIDAASQPLVKSYTYRLGTIDSCGTAHQAYTNQQTTMHLTTSAGLNGEVNLVWNAYAGYPWPPGYTTFYIFRSLNGGAYEAIDSIASNTSTYTDLNPPAGSLHYKIGIKTPACFQGGEAFTFSNRSSTNVVGISNAQFPDDVVLFPDPVRGSATLHLGQLAGKVNSLHLLSINGGNVSPVILPSSSDVQINMENLAPGIYILQIVTDNMTYRMPVAVQ